MENAFDEIIRRLQDAFDIPEFSGELSKGKLKGRRSYRILQASIKQLDELSRKFTASPEILFLSGIASRYLGDETRFQEQVDLALEIAPTYLEAVIAKKERERYLDPFCYLSIDDLLTNPNLLRPASTSFLRVDGARIDAVRDGINIKPIFIIKVQRSKMRRLLSPDMDMGLAAEICAVLPGSPGIPDDWQWPLGDSKRLKEVIQPFLDVLAGKKGFTIVLATCPMLADDANDPFFKVIYVNVFPINMPIYPPDYQPYRGRYEGLRLCSPPHKTFFVFFDEHDIPLLVSEVDLDPIKNDLLEIGEVIRLLPDISITMFEWQRAAAVHDEHCFYRIVGKHGNTYSIPKYRTGKERLNVIFGLEVRDDAIRAKRGQKQREGRELSYDIFISHSHNDQAVAYGLTEWIYRVWPDINLFMTSREQREIEEVVPGHYFLALHASRCVLFLATPSSLKSSYAQIELGAATQLGTKVIGVCADGSTLEDLKATEILRDLDIAVDLDHRDAESTLIKYISSTLNFAIPENYEAGLLPILLRKSRYIPSAESRASVDGSKIPDALKIAKGEVLSKEDALKWLDIVEKNVQNKARMTGSKPEFLPQTTDVHDRLIIIMVTSDDTKYDRLLKPFAALIDEQFCRKVALQWQTAIQQEMPFADKYSKLLQSARRIVEGSK